MKVALNVELTHEGMLYLSNLGCKEAKRILEIYEVEKENNARPWCDFYYRRAQDMDRNNPLLIKTIENLKEKAAEYKGAKEWRQQKIVEIPDFIEWFIDDNEGQGDVVHEEHRQWS